MKSIWTKIATLALAMLMLLSCFAFIACSDDTADGGKQDDANDKPGTDDHARHGSFR